MSAVPYGMFAAAKVRQNNEKIVAKFQSMEQVDEKLFEQYNLQLNPMKYNSKMMNSIWGMYNRYSVHNLKKNMDDEMTVLFGNQQMSSVGSTVEKPSTDPKGGKSPQFRVKNFWFAPENFY